MNSKHSNFFFFNRRANVLLTSAIRLFIQMDSLIINHKLSKIKKHLKYYLDHFQFIEEKFILVKSEKIT